MGKPAALMLKFRRYAVILSVRSVFYVSIHGTQVQGTVRLMRILITGIVSL